MNKFFFLILFCIFLLSIISASSIFDENHTQVNITISQNYSQINFFLNTEGLDWDKQNLTYEDITIENIYISSLLEACNFKIRMQDGYNYPVIENLSIEDGSVSQLLLDMIFDETSLDYIKRKKPNGKY